MIDNGKTIEGKLQMIRDSFGPNKCQCMTKLTRDLLTEAIEVKIKELVLGHDFRPRHRRVEHNESKEITEDDICIYEELKKQIETLPICEGM